MHSPELTMLVEHAPAPEPESLTYQPPRIDPKLLTIVVRPHPYSRPVPLARSRKPNLRKRWS